MVTTDEDVGQLFKQVLVSKVQSQQKLLKLDVSSSLFTNLDDFHFGIEVPSIITQKESMLEYHQIISHDICRPVLTLQWRFRYNVPDHISSHAGGFGTMYRLHTAIFKLA